MGSAVLNPSSRPQPPVPSEPTTAPESAEALRRQAAARIAALRQRRQQGAPSPAAPTSPASVILSAAKNPRISNRAADRVLSSGKPAAPADSRSRIAAAVAERYAQAQTYRAFLAAEAERAVQQARAAAEIAARNAQALAKAQQQLLDSLAAEAAAQRAAEAAATPAEASPPRETLWPDLTPTKPESEQDWVPRPSSARAGSNAGSAHANFSAPSNCHSERCEEQSHSKDCHPDPACSEGEGPASFSAAPPAVRVVLYEDIPPFAAPRPTTRRAPTPDPWDPEAYLLDEEISFRQSPVFEEPAGPPTALPANLIEFPRQLIASRRARPRYAEGPLRDEPATEDGSQLRIFEVDPAQIATTPDATLAAEAQWSSLWLDAAQATSPSALSQPSALNHRHSSALDHCHSSALDHRHSSALDHCHSERSEEPAFLPAEPADPALPTAATPQRHPARWTRRALAAFIDLGVVGAATLSFATASAAIAGHTASRAWDTQSLLTGAAASLQGLPVITGIEVLAVTGIVLSLAYQALFFTFSESTPGMRLARIGLCTFSDENPTRAAMRRRIPALALSTLLFGIGLLWALLDEDALPWHDLISRTYQRSY